MHAGRSAYGAAARTPLDTYTPPSENLLMRALASWCFNHRRLALLGWIVTLVAMTAIESAAGSAYSDNFQLKGTDSFDAITLLQHNAPKASGDTEQLVIAVSRGRVTDPAVV